MARVDSTAAVGRFLVSSRGGRQLNAGPMGGVKECHLRDSETQTPETERSRFPWAEAFFIYPDLWPVYLIGTGIFVAAPFLIASHTSDGWLFFLSMAVVVGGGLSVTRDLCHRHMGLASHVAIGLWFGCVLIALFTYADFP